MDKGKMAWLEPRPASQYSRWYRGGTNIRSKVQEKIGLPGHLAKELEAKYRQFRTQQ